MKIDVPAAAVRTTVTLANAPAPSLPAWQQGQQLQARVVTVESAQRVLLDIAGQQFHAQTGMKLVPGQILELVVMRPGTPPLLQLATTARTAEKLVQALRQALPQQVPLSETIHNFRQLMTAGGQALPPAIAAQIQAWLARLPGLAGLSRGDGLQQAVRDSGLFLEALLVQAIQTGGITTPLPDDLKARLLQLAEQLQRAVAEAEQAGLSVGGLKKLLRQTESALSRIQLLQLQSLLGSEELPTWLLELPVQFDDRHEAVQMRLTRENSHDGKPAWKVVLKFSFETLGAVEASVIVGAGNQASVSFNAERQQTADLFAGRLGELQSDLVDHGLQVGHLQARQGHPEKTAWLPECVLVDEQA